MKSRRSFLQSVGLAATLCAGFRRPSQGRARSRSSATAMWNLRPVPPRHSLNRPAELMSLQEQPAGKHRDDD
jgi:hypothetical protein